MRFSIIFLLVLFFVSCQDPKPQSSVIIEKSEFRTEKKHQDILNLEKKASQKIDNWLEYETLKNFLKQYDSISPNEALNNSKELNDLVRSVRDSVKPEFLKSKAFDARINLLHNETLRLYDMSSIPAIKSEEVSGQVDKLLDAFSAINSKINTLVLQADLDSQVSDPKFKFNRISSDSITSEKKLSQKEIQEAERKKKMNLSKEDRLKKRNLKLQEIKNQPNAKKKNN